MTSATTTKEQTMKAQATHKLIQLSAILGTASALAATCGAFFSDATLKREVDTLIGALATLRGLETR